MIIFHYPKFTYSRFEIDAYIFGYLNLCAFDWVNPEWLPWLHTSQGETVVMRGLL